MDAADVLVVSRVKVGTEPQREGGEDEGGEEGKQGDRLDRR